MPHLRLLTRAIAGCFTVHFNDDSGCAGDAGPSVCTASLLHCAGAFPPPHFFGKPSLLASLYISVESLRDEGTCEPMSNGRAEQPSHESEYRVSGTCQAGSNDGAQSTQEAWDERQALKHLRS